MAEVTKHDRVIHTATLVKSRAMNMQVAINTFVESLRFVEQCDRQLSDVACSSDEIECDLARLELEKSKLILRRSHKKIQYLRQCLDGALTDLEGEIAMADVIAVCPD